MDCARSSPRPVGRAAARSALSRALFGALIGLLALTGCADPAIPSEPPTHPQASAAAPEPSPSTPEPSPSTPEEPTSGPSAEATGGTPTESWTVTRVVDGDTLEVTGAAASETVRILGIDTPERGECGFTPAATRLSGILGRAAAVTLSTAGSGKDDRDRYDRILRYVDAGGVDVGLALIQQGLAIARYDSRDGYGAHPRERAYVAADEAAPAAGCPAAGPASGLPLTSVGTAPDPTEAYFSSCAAARAAGAGPLHRGQPGYGSHLDRDNDGIGCE